MYVTLSLLVACSHDIEMKRGFSCSAAFGRCGGALVSLTTWRC